MSCGIIRFETFSQFKKNISPQYFHLLDENCFYFIIGQHIFREKMPVQFGSADLAVHWQLECSAGQYLCQYNAD